MEDLPGSGVVLCPDADELVEVVRAQDGRVSGQVLKVVHDDRHKQVQHLHGHSEEVMKRETGNVVHFEQATGNVVHFEQATGNVWICMSSLESTLCRF